MAASSAVCHQVRGKKEDSWRRNETMTQRLREKIICILDRFRTPLATGGLLLGAMLSIITPPLVPPAAAADPVSQPDLSDHLPLLGEEYNNVDNPDQIDQPDELAAAEKLPGSLSADKLSRELSNPNTPLASLNFKQIYTSFKGDLPGASDQSSNLTLFQPVFPFPLKEDGSTNLFIRPAIPYFWE
jgi:hypothetical protein